jgi:uncharacterized protein
MNSRNRITDYLQKKGQARPGELLKVLKITEVGFYKQIKKLLAEGLIVKTGAGPHVVYTLNIIQTPQTLKKQIIPILKKSSVTRAAFFGSFARGDNRPDSDIDLLVELSKSQSLLDLIGLEQSLEDKFHKDFDLITFNSVNPRLKNQVYEDLIEII